MVAEKRGICCYFFTGSVSINSERSVGKHESKTISKLTLFRSNCMLLINRNPRWHNHKYDCDNLEESFIMNTSTGLQSKWHGS